MQTLKLTKKYEKYPEYKDSGVQWLEMVPKKWEVLRGKTIFRNEKDLNKGMKNDNVLSLTMGGVINRDKENNDGLLPSDYQTFQIFEKDDLVFKLIDLDNYKTSRVGLVHEKGIMSSAYIRLIAKDDRLIPKYFYYLYYHFYIRGIYNILGSGVRSTLNPEDLMRMDLILPTTDEQKNIVRHLEDKLILLDKVIEKKEKQIELLKEKRMMFINQAINNIKGAEEKLKYIASEENIKSELLSSHITYVGMENIESNTGKYIPSLENISPESVSKVFYKNNVLFGKLRPYLAKVYSSEFSGICSGEFLVLKPREEKMISKFLFYKLISKDFITKVNDSTYGSQMPRASWQFIGNQILAYPTLIEQAKIVDKLDIKTKLYEDAINKVTTSIEKLKEFKASLISNVVTGKIKV